MLRHKLLTAGFCIFFASLTVAVAANQKGGGKGDAAKGKETFEQCAICHNVDTDEKKMGPSLKGLFKRKTLQSGKPVSDATVPGRRARSRRSIRCSWSFIGSLMVGHRENKRGRDGR